MRAVAPALLVCCVCACLYAMGPPARDARRGTLTFGVCTGLVTRPPALLFIQNPTSAHHSTLHPIPTVQQPAAAIDSSLLHAAAWPPIRCRLHAASSGQLPSLLLLVQPANTLAGVVVVWVPIVVFEHRPPLFWLRSVLAFALAMQKQ